MDLKLSNVCVSDLDVEPELDSVDVDPETAPEPMSASVDGPPLVTTDEPESAGCYKPVSTAKFYGGRKSYGQRSERTRKRPARYSD